MNDSENRLVICAAEFNGWKATFVFFLLLALLVFIGYDLGWHFGANHACFGEAA